MARSHLQSTRDSEHARAGSAADRETFRAETLGSGAREWWPAFLAHQGAPEGRADPADWIVSDRSRRFFIDAFSPDGSRPRLSVGSEIPFLWRECRAAIEVTIDPDGSYEPHASIPRDATHFWDIADLGSQSGSLEELALFYADGLASPARLRVRMCRWGGTETLFRLHLSGGKPVLLPAGMDQRLAG